MLGGFAKVDILEAVLVTVRTYAGMLATVVGRAV
jgi:hypothetical protein